ncbi:MAG TPA: tetratricopeptide repeat protein [Polyangiaceae bacterium]|nr:tetratricopeptide repeat protein [Polyangiaceae bacterium]
MNAERDLIEDLLLRAGRGFERDAAVLSGDDERIERIERAVQRRYGARPPSRVRQVALAVAVGMLLAGAALGALRVAGVLDVAKPAVAPAPAPGAVLPSSAGAAHGSAARPAPSAAEPTAAPVVASATPDPPSADASARPVEAHAGVHSPAPAAVPANEASPVPATPEAAAKRFDDTSNEESASAATLFAAANRARVAGDVPRSIALSQQLLSQFPRSAEALSTHLSLGMLKLQQGRAAEALTEFQAYEQQGSGATLAEALWGKAQALQRLGRANEERAALTQLLARYPHGAYSAAAQKRLALLP